MSRLISKRWLNFRSRTYLSQGEGSPPAELLPRTKSHKHPSITVTSRTLLRMMRVFCHLQVLPIMVMEMQVSLMVLTLTKSTNSIAAHLIQITHSYFPTNKKVIKARNLKRVAQTELVQEGQPTPTRSPLEELDPSRVLREVITNLFIPAKNNS